MSTSLSRKVAFVTGGRQGIGKAVVETLAGAGASVAVVDVDPSVADVAAEISRRTPGCEVIAVRADVTSSEEIGAAVAEANRRLGRIDILINNAGVVGTRAFSWTGDEDVWRATVDINLVGTYRVTKAVVPQMVQARAGRVINIASISGKQGSIGNSAYSASKHGVVGLTRTLAQEFGILGLGELTANAVCPGVVDTPLVHGEDGLLDGVSALTGESHEVVMEKYILTQSLQHRLLDPQEVADMVLYLASDRARGITGQAINVCGGSVFN
ncbi:SDR family oxidoreductase [Nocardia amamiensis]|uniref:SDR family oxidoreductase n=1 Tax=Nocardia amamiensis TaxID=404578 RepID=A0ABS0CS38_9NOCA|nr:SDR family NAD(P)-dependent oxidoreductase [Nocardia amamiensis]MBF6299453.1 SDR family oxidoreductase [Nocardia amamiensis]